MKIINQIDGVLEKIECAGITLILTLMILLSFGQVILRNFFNEGILWADILLRHLVLWVGFLGAAIAARTGQHISIDFLPNVLPGSWLKPIRVVVNFAAGLISGFLAWAAWKFVRFEREAESVLFLDLPVWIFQVILPYSFIVISLRFLLNSLSFSGKSA